MIKVIKYPNRKFYCQDSSQYVTLNDMLNWIKSGSQFSVQSRVSGQDITNETLGAILAKEANSFSKDKLVAFLKENDK